LTPIHCRARCCTADKAGGDTKGQGQLSWRRLAHGEREKVTDTAGDITLPQATG